MQNFNHTNADCACDQEVITSCLLLIESIVEPTNCYLLATGTFVNAQMSGFGLSDAGQHIENQVSSDLRKLQASLHFISRHIPEIFSLFTKQAHLTSWMLPAFPCAFCFACYCVRADVAVDSQAS